MVGDEGRLELHRLLEERLGPRAAGLLMDQLPPVGWQELATKADVTQLAAALRGEMAEFRGQMRTEMAEFRAGIHVDMAALETRVTTVVNQQFVRMTWVMMTLMVTFLAGAFAVTRIP